MAGVEDLDPREDGVEAPSNAEVTSADSPEEAAQGENTESPAQPAAVSPSPIPILDRPPVTTSAPVDDVNPADLYEDDGPEESTSDEDIDADGSAEIDATPADSAEPGSTVEDRVEPDETTARQDSAEAVETVADPVIDPQPEPEQKSKDTDDGDVIGVGPEAEHDGEEAENAGQEDTSTLEGSDDDDATHVIERVVVSPAEPDSGVDASAEEEAAEVTAESEVVDDLTSDGALEHGPHDGDDTAVIAATSETASESASTRPDLVVEENDEPRGDVENSVKAAATPVRVSPRTEPATKTAADPVSIKPNAPAKEPRTVNESAGSAFADFEEEKSGRGWVKAVVGTLATILVLGGAYAAAQYALADEIAKNVSVAGVEIGGLSEADAAVKLNDELLPKLDEDVTLAAGDLNTTVVPSAVGITFDAEQTVEGLTGFSWSPSTLWEKLAGGEAIEPVLGVDNEQLDSAVAEVESALYVEPVSGTVSFVDGHAVATNAENGMGVDSQQVKQQLLAHLFSQTRPVPLTMQEVEPEVTQAATDAALATANKIASAAVMVEIDGQKAEIPQEAFTKNVDIKFENGQATFAFDGKKLATEVVKRTSDLLREAEDARFVFKDGKPVIEPGQAGTRIDDEQLATAFHAAATTDNRVAQVDLVETDPDLSAQKLEDLGIKEKVASFSTRITNDHWRTENLRVAASRITGYLVRPGEEFDLMKVIGPVSRENGYYPAGVIVNGVHTEGMGGGLSQVATTTYNAGFFAGMTDIAHRPHTVWIPRYPEGRESTLFSGSIDMIWRNDSETGILLRAYVADGNLTVEAWGTKTYEVETTTSPRRNVTPARMTTSTAANCSYYPTGQPGFSVTVTRKVTEIATGEVVADEAQSWTYRPDNGVTCKKDESKRTTKRQKKD